MHSLHSLTPKARSCLFEPLLWDEVQDGTPNDDDGKVEGERISLAVTIKRVGAGRQRLGTYARSARRWRVDPRPLRDL